MTFSFSRILWIILALLSAAMWLGIFPIYGNAWYWLVKTGYRATSYGSVNIRTLGICGGWFLLIAILHLYSARLKDWTRFGLAALAILFWLAIVTVIEIASLEALAQACMFGEAVWAMFAVLALEFAGACRLLAMTIKTLPQNRLDRAVSTTALTFTLLLATKALVLGLSPGTYIRV